MREGEREEGGERCLFKEGGRLSSEWQPIQLWREQIFSEGEEMGQPAKKG